MSNRPYKILIQQCADLKSVVFSLPAIELLKKNFPTVDIHYLCDSESSQFLSCFPFISKRYVLKKTRFIAWIKLALQLKKEKYDYYFCFDTHFSATLLGWLSGSTIRLNHQTKHYSIFSHHIEQYLSLLSPITMKYHSFIKSIYIDPTAHQALKKELKKHLNPDRKTICILLPISISEKSISSQVINDFLSTIKDQNKYNVILCGNCNSSIDGYPQTSDYLLNLTNRLSTIELVALIHLVDFYIGSNHGFTHIAAFLNKPLVFCASKKSMLSSGPFSPFFTTIQRSSINDTDLSCAFSRLFQRVTTADSASFNDCKKQFILDSIQVLYVVQNEIAYQKALPTIKNLIQQGLYIIPFYCPRFSLRTIWKLYHLFSKPGIHIIQGVFPKSVTFTLNILSLISTKMTLPRAIQLPFHPYISLKDYIKQYKKTD